MDTKRHKTARTKILEEFKGKYKVQTSASDEPVAAEYQPGGTLTAVGGKHTGRILEANEDAEGMGQ